MVDQFFGSGAIRTLCAPIAILVLSFYAQSSAVEGKAESTEKIIGYLIEEVARSNLTFIRNGERYSGEEAAEHLRRKYAYFRCRIETPEDFIRLCASKSLISGEPYLVATPQGNVPVESWLEKILATCRETRPHSTP